MQAGQATYGSQGHRHLQLEVEDAVFKGHVRKTLVSSVSRGEGVSRGLHSAEVVARGDDHCVDAVVDALVVRGGTVDVDVGNVNGLLEFFGIFGSR